MASFRVATEALTAASAIVAQTSHDVNDSHGGLLGASGALAGTAAEPVFELFLGAADGALKSLDAATHGLGSALNEVAMAYQLADGAAAAALKVKR